MADSGGLNLRHLFHQVALAFGRQVFANLCQLVSVVILGRALGPEGFGQFSVAILLPYLLMALLSLGIPSANIYYIARNDVPFITALRVNLRLSIVLALVGVGVSAVLLLGFSDRFFPGVPHGLLWGAALLFPVHLLYWFLVSLLQGKQDYKGYNIALIAPAVAHLAGAAGLVWGLGLGVPAALVSWCIGQAVGLTAAAWFVGRHREQTRASDVVAAGYARRCLSYGWKVFASNLLQFLNYRADIFLVNLFINPASAGVYVIAVQIAERLLLLSHATTTVLFPRLSELHDDELARQQLAPLVARWVNYSGLLVAVFLAVVAPPLVRLVFGSDYAGAALALLWLLPGIVILNCARVLAHDVAARGRPDLNVWANGITFVVNLIGNILLIPRYGIVGAALSTTMAYCTGMVVTLVFYSRLSQNPWWRPLAFEREDWDLLARLLLRRLKRGAAS